MAVEVKRSGAVVIVTINRPERRNALNGDAIAGIGAAFVAAEEDARARVVILTGAGDQAFCAGMDLFEPRVATRDGPGLEVFTNRCYPKPVIAAVNGVAVGGGFELALASDMVVAAEHATFAMPEVKRGLVGAGCSTRLSARVPSAIALEMGLTGDAISAERAFELGLVNVVVRQDQLLPTAIGLADRIAANAPLALKMTKELMFQEMGMHDNAEWQAIRAKVAPVFTSEDAKEGAAAFVEKRSPRWSGR